jgi:hypothetical protein
VLATVNDTFGAASRSLARSLTAAPRGAQAEVGRGGESAPFSRTKKRTAKPDLSLAPTLSPTRGTKSFAGGSAWDYLMPRTGLLRDRWSKVPRTPKST